MQNNTFYGQLQANPLATESNNLKLAGCGEPATVQQDFYSGAETGTNTVDTVTIDGVVYTLAGATIASLTWRAEIEQLLLNTGTNNEINVWVRASYGSGTLKFKHIGQRRVTSMGLSDGAQALTTAAATTRDLVA